MIRTLLRGGGLTLVLASAACGMRGSPSAPLIILPESVPLDVVQLEDEIYVGFDLPADNDDGTPLVDLDRIELYALTTHPDPERPVELSDDDWFDLATLVAEIPAPDPEPPELFDEAACDEVVEFVAPVEEATADGIHGREFVVREPLTFEEREPVPLDDFWEEEDDDEVDEDAVRVAPLLTRLPTFPRRAYRARALSRRGRESEPRSPVEVTLAAPPAAPDPPVVTYTETHVQVEWTLPATARRSAQDLLEPGMLESSPIIEFAAPSTYRVYAYDEQPELVGPPAPGTPEPDVLEPPLAPPPLAPLHSGEVAYTEFAEPVVTFGVNRCYFVRSVDYVDELLVVGSPSEPACVMPVDTFAPAPPRGLIALASGGAISLVWNPSPERDVVGYLILRRLAAGATLERLTPDPVLGTTYRDASVVAGESYAYAVQAVDAAVPPNISESSEEVTERAR